MFTGSPRKISGASGTARNACCLRRAGFLINDRDDLQVTINSYKKTYEDFINHCRPKKYRRAKVVHGIPWYSVILSSSIFSCRSLSTVDSPALDCGISSSSNSSSNYTIVFVPRISSP